MPLQAEFAFQRPSASPPHRLAELLALLRRAGRWLPRQELEVHGFTDRDLRALAELDLDGTIFSYPGSPGYKHFDLVTDAEFDRARALKSQGEKMLARWLRYQRRWHQRQRS